MRPSRPALCAVQAGGGRCPARPSGACHPAGVPLCWRRPVDTPQAGPRLGARRPRRHAGALRPKSGSRCHVRAAGQPVRRPPLQEAGDLSIPCHEPTRGDEPPGPPLRSPLRTRKVVPGRPRRGPEGHPPLSRRPHEPARRQHAVAEQARLRPPVRLSPARPRGPQGLGAGRSTGETRDGGRPVSGSRLVLGGAQRLRRTPGEPLVRRADPAFPDQQPGLVPAMGPQPPWRGPH